VHTHLANGACKVWEYDKDFTFLGAEFMGVDHNSMASNPIVLQALVTYCLQ
jgi:hypothetical protein